MPKKRILTTLINFDIAVLLFAGVGSLMGRDIPLRQILRSLVFLDSVGNSNWYIAVIIICYAISFLSACCVRRRVGLLTFALCVCVMVSLSYVRESWWYNTIMAYPAGCLYVEHRTAIEEWVKRRYWMVFICVAIVLITAMLFLWRFGDIICNVTAVLFAAFVILLTMKVKVGNPALVWMGAHLFPLYIYQRMPMQVFGSVFDGRMHDGWLLIYVALCVIATLIIAFYYHFWEVRFRQVNHSV